MSAGKVTHQALKAWRYRYERARSRLAQVHGVDWPAMIPHRSADAIQADYAKLKAELAKRERRAA